ncbi:MAG: squalene synthase HpnC [Phycisphaeraceae bacterium]|nr:squalene synthase HpnC [Phycisphaeraceae bacterium]
MNPGGSSSATLDPSTPPIDLLPLVGPEADDTRAPPTPEQALAYVRGLAVSHYENFSVLSSLVPADLRDDFAAVYGFCRWADDLGDETGNTPEARLRATQLLDWWRAELRACFAAAESGDRSGILHPVYVALASTIDRHRLPIQPFLDLIDAFQQDQRVTRYESWDQLVDYCARSANPVGRLVLHLGGYPDTPANADRYRMSDATCTALQLTNFWQDVRRDLIERDRVYLPSRDTGISAEQLRDWAHRPDDPQARVPFIRALRPLAERTAELFEQGRDLPRLLDSRIRPVVWLFGVGGRQVLGSVRRTGCVTLWERPTLEAAKKACLVGTAWLMFRLVSSGSSGRLGGGA